jgi:pre-mRNA-splicing factor SPF27
VPDDPHHALLPPSPTTTRFLTPLLVAELSRLSTAAAEQASTDTDTTTTTPRPLPKLSALDLTRYEAPTPPSPTALAALPRSEAAQQLQEALARAYTSHSYVASRRAHLALLDSYGKNAWLVGNEALEGEVRAVERELAETRRAIDEVTAQRREMQDGAGAELRGLEEAWRRGVGRVLETEAAAERVRREVLELRRRAAS